MNDADLSPSLFSKIVWGAFATVAYLLKRYMERNQHKIDLLEKAQANFVTREELGRELNLLRSESLQRHQENLGRLDHISSGMVRIHERIDKAFSK